jgi:hypothetical protein
MEALRASVEATGKGKAAEKPAKKKAASTKRKRAAS